MDILKELDKTLDTKRPATIKPKKRRHKKSTRKSAPSKAALLKKLKVVTDHKMDLDGRYTFGGKMTRKQYLKAFRSFLKRIKKLDAAIKKAH